MAPATETEVVARTSDAGGKKRKRKRNRWGDAPPAAEAPSTTTTTNGSNVTAQVGTTKTTSSSSSPALDSKAKALALKESIQARLAALKNKTGVISAPSTKRSSEAAAVDHQAPVKKKAKHYELDLSTTGPTFQKQNESIPKKKVNPYLAHKEQDDEQQKVDSKNSYNAAEDDRLVRSSKPRQRNKPMLFVEPGKFTEIAERKRKRAANAELSGFVSGRKAGTYVESAGMASVYGGGGGMIEEDDAVLPPRADTNTETEMPQIMEWWDIELLPSKLKKEVAAQEGRALSKQTKAKLQQLGDSKSTTNDNKDEDDNNNEFQKDDAIIQLEKQCWEKASLSNSKTSTLVQHIVPIKPPGADDGPAKQPTLYLTKKELKRKRKLARQEKQREKQDMQAVGLIPPPEPRLTMKNFFQVLGDQAVLDPSQMEQKVMEQIKARQRAHMERNEERKLTKEQRREKKAAKLMEDTSRSVSVALFYVKDMSHPYHRTKVDLNAQQNNITGGVLECSNPSISCVICEGGPKAIKRYTRLMLVRMKWTGQDLDEEEEEEDNDDDNMDDDGEGRTTHKFNPENKCELVWTGMASKRMFSSFVFQSCETSDMARKVLEAKGVAQFWDQVLTHASGRGESVTLKLIDEDDEHDDDEEEIIMMKTD